MKLVLCRSSGYAPQQQPGPSRLLVDSPALLVSLFHIILQRVLHNYASYNEPCNVAALPFLLGTLKPQKENPNHNFLELKQGLMSRIHP
jgi:hypothetical protein